jgi:hypothetical protein
MITNFTLGLWTPGTPQTPGTLCTISAKKEYTKSGYSKYPAGKYNY